MYKLKSKEGHVSVAGMKDPITKDNIDQYQFLIYKLKKSGNPAGDQFDGDHENVEDPNGKKVAALPKEKNESFDSLKSAKAELVESTEEAKVEKPTSKVKKD